jgi:hypothetical protein
MYPIKNLGLEQFIIHSSLFIVMVMFEGTLKRRRMKWGPLCGLVARFSEK